MTRIALFAALAVTLVVAPGAASAFCGFYVDGAGSAIYEHATQVVILRDGTRTVLTMQNDYQGPAEAFAMVVPVPTVLHKEDVKTLDRAIFDRIDKLDAPRLVEYWERDPCNPYPERVYDQVAVNGATLRTRDDLGVKVEARFVVGEYDVVILSASDSTGLASWLEREKYAIPAGAAPYLRPYVEGGSKFFVAKVDPSKVTFDEHGHALLSPLRFHYDTDDFTLPIRLGLVNSSGTQDLIVHVLSPDGRVAVANRPGAFVPTNLDVRDGVRTHFAEFYAALFDRTLDKTPHAVVTEYAWSAQSCDPCPEPPLTDAELLTLGADAVAHKSGFTLTRLHARYGKDDVADDLVFAHAEPVEGGREVAGADGRLAQDARPSSDNSFQARYVIRHAWAGPIACHVPQRGQWGGPNGDSIKATPAQGLALAPRGGVRLDQLIASDVPTIDVRAAGAAIAPPATSPRAPEPPPAAPAPSRGCGCGASAGGDAGGWILMFVIAAHLRRKPRSER